MQHMSTHQFTTSTNYLGHTVNVPIVDVREDGPTVRVKWPTHESWKDDLRGLKRDSGSP